MGALPKRKISKARKRRRRNHDKLMKPSLSTCPKCGSVKRPHFKCPNCGHYGKLVKTEPSKEAKKKTKTTKSKTKKVSKKAEKK
jgi:large subunit ribosomal protein L32